MLVLLVLLQVFAGCVREEDPVTATDDLAYPTEGKALIKVSVNVPTTEPLGTKAMADLPSISSMRVVVFGSSGFMKESVDVDPGDFESATTNGNTTTYAFSVHLSLSDSKNLRVHVLANCDATLPWKYEDVVMGGSAYTTGNQDAYWYRFILPNGIVLKKEYNAETERMEYVKNGNYFVVEDEVEDCFENLPLLRNFAKISVESTTPQLVLDPSHTMAVINTPDRGSVAPYNSTDGTFVTDYHTKTYDYLKQNYPGFAPTGMRYNNTDPDQVTFYPCGKSGNTVTGGIYMYERPKPSGSSDTPSYVIVYGTYYPLKEGKNLTDWKSTSLPVDQRYPNNSSEWLESTGVDGYYKIDFMDDDGYYAILRNFRYHIRITGVSKAGANSPSAAGSTGGTGDVSSSTEAAGLTDISDGYGRIAVSYVEMTIVEQKAVVELKYKFITDAEKGDEAINNYLSSETDGDGNPGPVTITFPEEGKSGPVNVIASEFSSTVTGESGTTVGSATDGYIKVCSETEDREGYRTIHFTTSAPNSEGRSEQTIRITGKIDDYKSIYREVKYYLMEKQNMTVTCEADEPDGIHGNNYVEDVAGEGVNVKIKIPILLPESMFPLVFYLESDQLSITPNTTKYDDENLPVATGESICDGKAGKKTFQYVKTLSYEDYGKLVDNNGKTIVCHFKTNKAASASTIYVTNEYFNKGSAAFNNYSMYEFSALTLSDYNASANTNLTCTVTLDPDDSSRPRTIQLALDGVVPRNTNGWTIIDADDGLYSYTISSGNSVTLNLKTITSASGFDNKYNVTVSAFDSGGQAIYHEASVGNTAIRMTLNHTLLEMEEGDTRTLVATLWPDHLNSTTVTWTSSNTSVATVSSTGKVTAVGSGMATITAVCGDAVARCSVHVGSFGIDKTTMFLEPGQTGTIGAFITPEQPLVWSSSNTSVATVDNSGVVTAVAKGTATITVTSEDGAHTATCSVKVLNRYFTVNLDAGGNNGTYGNPWTEMSDSDNPDSGQYYAYQSVNTGNSNKIATMSITIYGYSEFTIGITSVAETGYDYVVVKSTMLTSWSASSAATGAKASTKNDGNDGTFIAVTLTSEDGLTEDETPHTFYIQYGKDGSVNTNPDSGYVLIPKSYNKQ